MEQQTVLEEGEEGFCNRTNEVSFRCVQTRSGCLTKAVDIVPLRRTPPGARTQKGADNPPTSTSKGREVRTALVLEQVTNLIFVCKGFGF